MDFILSFQYPTISTMKNLIITLSIVLCSFSAFTSFSQSAQNGKPSLFANYPSAINCTEAQLSSLFSAAPGQNVSMSLPGNFTIAGSVISNTAKFSNLQAMVIKLPAFNNMVLALSKRSDDNNRITYVGHLFNSKYSDGYELKRNTNGDYQFIKIETEKILQDCTM